MDPSGLCNGSAGGGNPGRFKGSGVFVLDKASTGMISLPPCHDVCASPAADMPTTCSIGPWGGRGFSASRGISRPSRRFSRGEKTSPATRARLVRDANPLAPRALAARRRRPLGVHALADGDAYPALARGAPHVRHGTLVPGTLQVVSDRRGRSPADGLAVCGTQSRCGRIWCALRRSGAGRAFGIACRAAGPCWTRGRWRCRGIGGGTSKRQRRRQSWPRCGGR